MIRLGIKKSLQKLNFQFKQTLAAFFISAINLNENCQFRILIWNLIAWHVSMALSSTTSH